MSLDSQIGDKTYLILASGSTTTSVTANTVTFTDTDCILTETFEFREPYTGEWQEYSSMSTPPAWITNFNAADNSFDIVSTDSSLA